MIKFKAGKLGDREEHEVVSGIYTFKWLYGDEWKTLYGCSTVVAMETKTRKVIFELHIDDVLSLCVAKNVLKQFDVELVEKYRERSSFLLDYYYINSNFEIKSKKEKHTTVDEDRFEKGNYFATFDDAYNSELYGLLKRYSTKMKGLI